MNEYKYKDIYVGLKESFAVNITDEMMHSFREITGDANPLHNDGGFAKERGYVDRVAYGMLTASFASTLAGIYLPGKYSLIREVDVKMIKPVFVGDTLTITGVVDAMDDRFSVLYLKITVENSKSEKVLRGKMQVGVLE